MSSTWRRKDLYEIVTDQNVKWRKETITLDRLCPDTPQGWMQNFGSCGTYDFHMATSHLQSNETALQEAVRDWNVYVKNHGKGSENDPLIVVPNATSFRVYDGNGRLAIRITRWITERSHIPEWRLG